MQKWLHLRKQWIVFQNFRVRVQYQSIFQKATNRNKCHSFECGVKSARNSRMSHLKVKSNRVSADQTRAERPPCPFIVPNKEQDTRLFLRGTRGLLSQLSAKICHTFSCWVYETFLWARMHVSFGHGILMTNEGQNIPLIGFCCIDFRSIEISNLTVQGSWCL